MNSSRQALAVAVAALTLGVTAVAVAVVRSDDPVRPRSPSPSLTPRPSSHPATFIDPDTTGVVETTRPAAIRPEPSSDAPVLTRLRAGIVLPATDEREAFFAVLTPCEARGWVAAADVRVHPVAAGDPQRLSDATIVIDPGHGGQLPGAVGPTGLAEKDANTDITQRLVERLEGARVFITRDGDFTGGLHYRAAIADGLRAHAFVSVHNNAEPDGPSDGPGSETYYQYRSPASKRLAGLLYEELVRALRAFEARWVADTDAGAKYRLNPEDIDYFALLREADVPTVLVEALYVSNPTEEALLRRDDVLDAVAGAIAAGFRRFFETEDPGSGFVEPYPREPGPSGRLPTECLEPTP